MSKIRNTQSINISDSSNVSVDNIHNTVTNTQNGETAIDEIAKAFEQIYQKVRLLSEGTDKADAQNAVKALEVEARRGTQSQEKNIKKWLNFLLETAPDVWEVVVDIFTHPIKGISTVFQKIAKRAKEERETNNPSINSTTISE
jgi:hypothetical protein